MCKVSFQAVVMALRNYGLISEQEKSKFFAILAARGYREAEPEPLRYFEKNIRYNLHVQNLYRAGAIGVNKVAEYLGLPIIEARRVVQEWGVGS